MSRKIRKTDKKMPAGVSERSFQTKLNKTLAYARSKGLYTRREVSELAQTSLGQIAELTTQRVISDTEKYQNMALYSQATIDFLIEYKRGYSQRMSERAYRNGAVGRAMGGKSSVGKDNPPKLFSQLNRSPVIPSKRANPPVGVKVRYELWQLAEQELAKDLSARGILREMYQEEKMQHEGLVCVLPRNFKKFPK